VLVERLTHLITDARVAEVDDLLRGLDGRDRAGAKSWFKDSRPWFQGLSADLFADPHATNEYTDQYPDLRSGTGAPSIRDRHDINSARVWIEGICAVSLCHPSTAARRIPWQELHKQPNESGEAALLKLLLGADREWVAAFADVVSRDESGVCSRVLRTVVVRHALPYPSGRNFYLSWLWGDSWKSSGVDTLRDNPLMPDMLLHYLASGHCAETPWLPEALAQLVESGHVDRTALLEHVLNVLTAPQRPGSQRVLAEILVALNLRAQEIPGGLTFLLGVLSTSHGAVGRVLLPHAVELVADAEGLVELTTVVGGRSERKQKEMLLGGLKAPALQAAVGIGPVLEALKLLGGSEDAAFAAKVARVGAGLGAVAEPGEAPAATGLWELSPVPSGGYKGTRPWDPTHLPTPWGRVRNAYHYQEESQSWRVDVATLGEGLPADWPLRTLELPRLRRALEDLFLAGGMRQSWAVAIAIADACCGTPRKPAGLADLLRMLASYASEAPLQELPTNLFALAAGDGRSKAQMEARKLGATLSGTAPEEFMRNVSSAKPPAVERAVIRGLWHAAGPKDPLLSETRLEDLTLDLPNLRLAFEANFAAYHQNSEFCFWGPGYSETDTPGTQLTNPDRLLGAIVRAIYRHGAGAVREALTGIERPFHSSSMDVIAAIDLWVADRLDVSTFWRVAFHGLTHHEVTQVWWDDPTMTRDEVRERVIALPGLSQALDIDPLVLPSVIDSAPARLVFLRAGESLLLAGGTPVVLCAPTYADCTLDFDDLLARMRAADGGRVGPLDLVQALNRLRPTDPARLVELEGLTMATAADFTDPEGVTEWDAVDLVRTWVGNGGLPLLEPANVEGGWSTTAKAPVPWSRCAAAPARLREDPWSPGPMIETLRLMPQWGDRTMVEAYQVPSYYDPRHFPGRIAGPFGLPLHDRLLSLMTLDKGQISGGMRTVLDVARHQRLDPEVAAAAAVGRHGAGSLAAGRLAQSIGTVFENGGFRGMWPSALAIGAALCEVRNRPSGLPDLLRLLTAYAHEVPEPQVPDPLRRFAQGRGSSRSHVESRVLVAALEQS
jgi:hypothetical protein